MKNLIVAFHIGRGGRFYNAGFKSFEGEHSIDYYTDSLFTYYENEDELRKMIQGRPNLEEKFEEARDSNDWSFFENRLKFKMGEEVYYDECGNTVGLTVKEANEGIGCINIDNDYNTTYCCKIEDCDDEELDLIRNSNNYKSLELLEYLNELDK